MKKNSKKILTDFFKSTKIQNEEKQIFGDGIISQKQIKLSSWNVNGLRAINQKGELKKYLNDYQPDLICLSEIKISQNKFDMENIKDQIDSNYTYQYFNFCKPPIEGYSGVAILSKFLPKNVSHDFDDKHNQEGRTLTIEFDKFYLVTAYVPNSGSTLDRLSYRTKEWDKDFNQYLQKLKKEKNVIVCGDLNVAHQDIDLANPKSNKKSPGFTIEERNEFQNLLDSGFEDIYRVKNPDIIKYSWFSYRSGARKKNIGWRIDYFLIDNTMNKESIVDAQINNDIFGSDHCPVELIIDLEKL